MERGREGWGEGGGGVKQRTQKISKIGILTLLSHFIHKCSLRGCIRSLAPAQAVLYFQSNQNGLTDLKGNKTFQSALW